MGKMTAKIADLDVKIATWTDICRDYPMSGIYAKALADLQKERAELALEIGKKKFLMKTRSRGLTASKSKV